MKVLFIVYRELIGVVQNQSYTSHDHIGAGDGISDTDCVVIERKAEGYSN